MQNKLHFTQQFLSMYVRQQAAHCTKLSKKELKIHNQFMNTQEEIRSKK